MFTSKYTWLFVNTEPCCTAEMSSHVVLFSRGHGWVMDVNISCYPALGYCYLLKLFAIVGADLHTVVH